MLFDNIRKREWGRLHNKELYSSQNIIRVIKSRRIRCAGQEACTGDRESAYTILMGRHEGKRPLERWEVILKWIFKKWDGGWTGFIWLKKGTGGWLL
jgi:hypothetical protein